MGWIKFDKDLVDDPRILCAAEALAERYTVSVETSQGSGFAVGSDLQESTTVTLMRNAVTGALVTLWVYADTHIRDGDVLPISTALIDRMVGIDGFCELIGPTWVQETNYGTYSILPGYCAKNGLISKEKRKNSNAERQRRYRERHAISSNAKSNAQRNAVTNADVTRLDQDLDQDLDKEKSNVGLKPSIVRQQAEEVLNFLNEKTGRSYQPVAANVGMIAARLKEGATVEDLRAVIAKKCREWRGDEKMDEYLRPKTLFNATNYAQYRGEIGNAEAR